MIDLYASASILMPRLSPTSSRMFRIASWKCEPRDKSFHVSGIHVFANDNDRSEKKNNIEKLKIFFNAFGEVMCNIDALKFYKKK